MSEKASSDTNQADGTSPPSAPSLKKPKKPRKTPPELLVPEAVDGVQVNFCKNPLCPNFGIPAEGIRRPGARRRPSAIPTPPPRYKPSGSETPFIQCQSCGECPPIKSNIGIKEEFDRLAAYLRIQLPPCCPNDECENHKVPVSTCDYRRFGQTAIGSPRWQCKRCGTTFSRPMKSTHRQQKSHKNADIFRDLVNKVPLKRIAKTNRISMKALYDKIDFIYEQCVAFVAHRERGLPHLKQKWMEVSVDRQEHMVNWFDTSDKRNIRLYAVASVDNRSGYVFGSHLNYDPSLNLREIEAEMHLTQDHKNPAPFRKYARLWTRSDFHDSKLAAAKDVGTQEKFERRKKIDELVDAVYEQAATRPDVEAYDAQDVTCRLPEWGMQVHAEYTLYAHFWLMRRLLGGVERLRFYMDQDSGIRAACLAAFVDRIRAKTCDAFFVKVGKELSQGEKLARVNRWRWRRDEFAATNTGYEDVQERFIRRTIVENRLNAMTVHGKWNDLWLEHPSATMSEPEKMVCYLTNLKANGFDYNMRIMAMMYDRASLHYVDSFFMRVRRLVSLLERPISSSSTAGRKWFGYSAYRPIMVAKLMEIFRVHHNYVEMTEGMKRRRLQPGQKKRPKGTVVKKSPAMRLGLARGSVTEEDILYFMPKQ